MKEQWSANPTENRKKTRRKKGLKAKSGPSRGLALGWVIVHASGAVETDYFQFSIFLRASFREQWRRKYRPDCRIVRAKLTWPAATATRAL